MSNNRVSIVRVGFCVLVLISSAVLARAATFSVGNLSDAGAGSLRQAILDANSSANVGNTPDLINFNGSLNAGGTIDLVTPLPPITDAVQIIYGSGNRIELNGAGTQGSAASIGFDVQAANCASASPNCTIWGFSINRFADVGIRVGPGADNVMIAQNYVGTNIGGTSNLCPDAAHVCGNFNAGIRVEGASGVIIGTNAATPDPACPINSPCGGHGNTIGGNGRGIVVSNGLAAGNVFKAGTAIIHNNYIGVTTTGVAIGNNGDGILIAGTSNNLIGGITAGDTNFINGNGGNGINIVADRATGAGNVVIDSPASNNTIQGNNIGYSGGSNSSIPNNGSGIVIAGSNNIVGGTSVAARNVITGNHTNGVSIYGALATGNSVQGNYIGVGSNGSFTALGNDIAGVQIAQNASGNTVGGTAGATPGACTGACNTIANNGTASAQSAKAGLYLDTTSGSGNSIRANSIYANGSVTGLGIDLGAPGSTANDVKDQDAGANDLQNRPSITSASTNKSISGSLNSTPGATFTIDFFRNDAADGLVSEARTYIGSKNVTTDVTSGDVSFSFVTTATLTTTDFITATATRVSAPFDTSEISDATPVSGAPTAAGATLDGRVITNGGRGIRSATVSVTLPDGRIITVRTNALGYYRFDGLPVGAAYVISASAVGYRFAPRLVMLTDNVSGFDLVPEP